MVDWVISCRVNESCYVGSLTRRGLALVEELLWLLRFLPLKALVVLLRDMLEQCWREVDCLLMVKPDATSQLGIHRVCMWAFLGVIGCW